MTHSGIATPTEQQDHRARIYWDSDIQRIVYRNSALWTCKTSLARERAGFGGKSKEEEVQDGDGEGDNREEGRIHETWFREVYLPRNGYVVKWIEREIDLPIPGTNIVIRMHLDGGLAFLEDGDGRVIAVLEIKTGGETQTEVFLRKGIEEGYPHYLGQFSAPMIATGLPLHLYWKNRNSGDVYIRRYETPPYSFAQLILRVYEIEDLAARQSFPRCEEPYRSCFGFFCPHKMFHEPLPPNIERPDLEPLAREYVELSAVLKVGSGVELAADDRKQLFKRKEAVQKTLSEHIGQHMSMGAGELEAGFQRGSDFLDLSRFAQEDPELYRELLETYRATKRGNFYCRPRKAK